MVDYRLDWGEVSSTEKAHLTPGIVQALEIDGPHKKSASNLESKKLRTNIGKALKGLKKAGFLEEMESPEKYRFAQEDTESLTREHQEVKRKSQELYMEKIGDVLEGFEDSQQIVHDIAERGIVIDETNNGTEILPEYRDDYSETTLEFLTDMTVIDNEKSREIASDERDIKHIESYMTAKALGYEV